MTTTRFSDYDLADTLGQGGMASVFRATYRPTGEVVALKRMLPHIADNDVFVARFVREVELSSKLTNPHVVRVQGYGQDDEGSWFLALEFCDGGTLVPYLKQVPKVPAPLVALMLDEMLEGLQVAHEAGIIHRDIKPPNILVTKAGVIKLSDLGIARSAGDETLTATGEVIGTPAYMSPEQAHGLKALDGRSDLFAVGMLAYRMLVGSNPYASDNVATSILRVTTGPDLKLGDVMQTLPPILEGVIDGLVVKDREARLSSARAARELLAPLCDGLHARFPDLMRRFVTSPAPTAQAIARACAADEIAAARACVDSAPARALVHAARAQAHDPGDLDAASLLAKLATLHGFELRDSTDVRIGQARAELNQKPNDPVLVRKLANLFRGAQNPLEAARYLKRYLGLRPDDTMARHQLEELLGPDDVAALTGTLARKPVVLKTGDIMRGVKTGGFVDKAVSATRPTSGEPERSRGSVGAATGPGGPRAPGTFGAPVIVTGGPSDHMTGTAKFVVVAAVVAVVGAGVSLVGTLIKKGSDNLNHTLTSVEHQQVSVLGGLVDGTQAPFVERAQTAARLADWQSVIETTNFGLSADPERGSRTTPRLLLWRSEAWENLGNPAQALADARLAKGLAADGSAERTEGAAREQRLQQIVPPAPTPSNAVGEIPTQPSPP